MTKTEKQLVEYDLTTAAISKLSSLYMDLTVSDIEDEAGFEEVELARKVVKGKRIAVEKQRKVFKSDALEHGRMVDSKAKEIFSLLEPIETHLTKEGDKIRDEEKRIEAEKEAKEKAKTQGRVDDLLKVNVVLDYFTVATMTDEDYDTFYTTSRTNYEAEQTRLAAEEKAKAEKEEAERLEREAESKRLADEKERLEKWDKEQKAKEEKIKAEQKKVQKELEAFQAKLKATQDKIDADKKAAQDKIDREARDKRLKEEAMALAEKEAQEETEKAAQEKVWAEEEAQRKADLLPDKKKVQVWVDANLSMPVPSLKTEGAKEVLRIAVEQIDNILHGVAAEIEEL